MAARSASVTVPQQGVPGRSEPRLRFGGALPEQGGGVPLGSGTGAASAATRNPRNMAGTAGDGANPSPHFTRARAEEGSKRPSHGDAGFEEVDHPPQPIRLAALDDFQRFQPAKGVVRRLEPDRQRVRRDEFGERLE